MRVETRKILDKAFTAGGYFSIVLMALSLIVILAPIFWKGMGALLFTGTIEFRKVERDLFRRGDTKELDAEIAASNAARKPIYEMVKQFESELAAMPRTERAEKKRRLKELKDALKDLFGPFPGEPKPVLVRQRYGQTRWDRAQVKTHVLLYVETWDYSCGMGKKAYVPRATEFAGTSLEKLFPYVETHIEKTLLPRFTFYPRFLTDTSRDAHFFGGIWSEILGTIYLTIGAMLFAIPMGVISAIYLCEYAKPGKIIDTIRVCVSALAGVPSIIFGLFGLAFFLNTLGPLFQKTLGWGLFDSKSVLAGSLTLSLLVLPTIIRAAEEAILAVPPAYKEASLALGAGKWQAIWGVILPAALPGVLTGVVISMGRAAGETAPIIFTAAVSVGQPITFLNAFREGTAALPWNIYNLCAEHEAADEIRHVQYGMVLALVAIALLLNLAAIIARARISRKLKG